MPSLSATGTSGFSNVTSAKSFEVSANGWYAVCATDATGNFSYKLIEITNITASSGGGNTGTGTTSVAVTGVTISGTAMVGQTLTATPAPANATSVTYQWYASDTNDNTNGTVISGKTAKTLVLDAGQVGKFVYVVVKGDASSTATSAQTVAVKPAPIAVTLNSVTANGSPTTTTTELTLNFSAEITGLAASDITVTGATKNGLLVPTATTGQYTLPVTVTANGSATVTAITAPSGYVITGVPKSADVYVEPTAVDFISAEPDGVAGVSPTTKVTLKFDATFTNLALGDITVTGDATKGSLSGGTGGVYELTLTGITASGTINIAISKSEYTFTPPSKTGIAVVYYVAPPAPSISAVRTAGTDDIVVTLSDGKFDSTAAAAASNWTISGYDSGLTLGTITYNTETQVTIAFTGEASANCTISITPKTEVLATGIGTPTGTTVGWSAPVWTFSQTRDLAGVVHITVLKDSVLVVPASVQLHAYVFNGTNWYRTQFGTSGNADIATNNTAGNRLIISKTQFTGAANLTTSNIEGAMLLEGILN